MIDEILLDLEEKMEKSLDSLKDKFMTIRAGKANPAILNLVKVSYYGAQTPLNQLASITAPEARLLAVQPFDVSVINDIVKAIQSSDLGLNPMSDGKIIRLAIPKLSEERRKDLVKLIKKTAEEAKISVRNIRRSTNEDLKKLEKNKELTKDDLKNTLDDVQKSTDEFIKKIDEIANNKEKDIMES